MSKFDEMFDIGEILEEIAEQEASREFKDVPTGFEYEVRLVHGELKESKAGNPMVALRFRVISDAEHNDEFKGQTIFYNQVVTKGFQLQIVYRMFTAMGFPGKFESFAKLEDDVKELVDNEGEYLLEYGENDKGFNTYKILETYK